MHDGRLAAALRTTQGDRQNAPMADELDPAFPSLKDDQRFSQHSAKMRAALDNALTNPPVSCAGVTTVAEQIGEACKACHQDFRG